jgi:hypothetical protein
MFDGSPYEIAVTNRTNGNRQRLDSNAAEMHVGRHAPSTTLVRALWGKQGSPRSKVKIIGEYGL